MSKTADKTANRSSIKTRWHHEGFAPKPPTPPPATDSWWRVACAPDAREQFIEAARTRAKSAWSNVSPAPMDGQKGFR